MGTKNFIVTGANSYLGKAVIKYLIGLQSDEVKILTIQRSERDSQIFTDYCRGKSIINVDLLKESDLNRLPEEISTFFKEEPFHVINCAGGYWDHFPFEEVSLDFCHKTINENFLTVFNAAYYLVPLMKKRGEGHFITFGCNSIKYHYPYMAPFTVSKQAVATLMKSLCNEYSKWNLQFNCFLLTTLKTEREKNFKPNGDYDNWIEPKQVAELVYSLTQQTNSLINGTEIELLKYSEQYNWDGYFKRIQKS